MEHHGGAVRGKLTFQLLSAEVKSDVEVSHGRYM